MKWLRFGSLALALFATSAAGAEIVVRDDLGATISLPRPAQRIVSLAPHATELLFALGAGSRIVGTLDTSDTPADTGVMIVVRAPLR